MNLCVLHFYSLIYNIVLFNKVIAVLSAVFDKTGTEADQRNMRTRWRLSNSGDVNSASSSGMQRPCLIVCPKTVVDNWVKEFEKWGFFKVDVLQTGRPKAHEAEDILLRAKQGIISNRTRVSWADRQYLLHRINRNRITVVLTSRSICYGVISGL